VNADGADDLLVGVTASDAGGASDSGAVYLVLGPVTGSATLSTDLGARITGKYAGDYAGSVATAGDVDGNGLDDVLVGAYAEDAAGSESGAVYLFLAPFSGALSVRDADARLVGENAYDVAGIALAPAGDPNDDGWADILVGAPGTGDSAYTTTPGSAYLLYGGF